MEQEMQFRMRVLFKVPMVLAIVAVLAGVVMVLWNVIMPDLFFGVHPIDYWHALGLLILSRILFGGFRGHGGWHERRHWQKWQAMTEEERALFHRGASGPRRTGGESA